MMDPDQRFAVIVRDTGNVAYLDDGSAAIADSVKDALRKRKCVAEFMGWNLGDLAISRLLFVPVHEAALEDYSDDEDYGVPSM